MFSGNYNFIHAMRDPFSMQPTFKYHENMKNASTVAEYPFSIIQNAANHLSFLSLLTHI